MYTLLGRALLGLIVAPDSSNYIWRFFCGITDPFVALIAPITPKAAAPVVVWLFGVVWLVWRHVGLTLMFASLMVSTATIILGGIPEAIYERWVGARRIRPRRRLWVWLAGAALLTLPAMGNFFGTRL
jgi:hypothetical protein